MAVLWPLGGRWEDLPQATGEKAGYGPQALGDGISATNGQLEDERWSIQSKELLKIPKQISP